MRVCVIGGIGSGKSEFIRVARSKNIPCLVADEINKELMDNQDYINKISEFFSTAVVNNKIDKKVLSNIVFNNEAERKKLNSVAHPAILEVIKNNKEKDLIVELPLFVESNVKDLFDVVVLVHTPVLKRIYRLKKRGLAIKDSIKRIKSQVREKELKKYASYVIKTASDIKVYDKRIEELLSKIGII